MNEIQVTVRGNITTDLRTVQFDDGNIITSFRMASNARRYDAQNREWVNAGTTFVNVNCRRALATNAAISLAKGQPVVVTGKLRERIWEKEGRSGRTLEIEADGLGHDLSWGTSVFKRVVRVQPVNVADEEAERMAAEVADEERQDLADLADFDGHVDLETGEIVTGDADDPQDDASELGRALASA